MNKFWLKSPGSKKYYFERIAVGGHAFFKANRLKNSIQVSASRFGKRYGMKFTCRETDEGMYVYRLS